MLSACNLLKNNINDPKALTSKDMVSLTYRPCLSAGPGLLLPALFPPQTVPSAWAE